MWVHMRCSKAPWEIAVCEEGRRWWEKWRRKKKNSSVLWANYETIQTIFLTSGGYTTLEVVYIYIYIYIYLFILNYFIFIWEYVNTLKTVNWFYKLNMAMPKYRLGKYILLSLFFFFNLTSNKCFCISLSEWIHLYNSKTLKSP